MSPPRSKSRFRREGGVIIILVAIFLLFVVGAMAALSIDVVTFYTARSEAQLAADAAALAGARVLANSGATSDTNDATMMANAQILAAGVATQVARTNLVGGQTLPTGQIQTWFNGAGSNPCAAALQVSNPCVTVQVTAYLPVFFARIWGSTQVTIAATATAEAFNPSGLATGSTTTQGVPIAPSCVKPWMLPNLDPVTGNPIFDTTTGQILNPGLLGAELSGSTRLHAQCNGPCPAVAQRWQYFVGDDVSFPHPTQALPACALTTNFQASIAGCVQTPIVCPSPSLSPVTIDTTTDSTLDQQAAEAVDCLTHTSGGKGDTISAAMLPPTAFEFTAGEDNPLVQAGSLSSGASSMVSDSLVTVPVFDNSPFGTGNVGTPVTVIGFLQLFLEPNGQRVPTLGGHVNQIRTKIINLVGCGTNLNATPTTPVYGNGASAVPVRLISPP
jgi:Flp pilus assembly protein TadG